MNNEENKPIQAENQPDVNVSDSSVAKNGGGWWNGLTKGIKIGIIAGISCLLIAVILLVVLLVGGNDGNDTDDGGNGAGTGDVTQITYTITVVTEGGMALAKRPVYIHEYEDGALGDIAGYSTTDENGKAVIKLPDGKLYAARIDLPEGYNGRSFYPLVQADHNIKVSSSLLPDNGLIGMTYNLGSVMHDFTVTTIDGETFTLSEVLKEKKAVLLNFWYTECSWCVTEFPLMQKAYERCKGKRTYRPLYTHS